MGKLTDYIDRWRTATPVRLPEIEIENIPLYPKDPDLKLRETGEPEKVTQFVQENGSFVEVPTFESLLERLERLEVMVEEMKK